LRYTIPGAIQIVTTAAQSVFPAPVVLVGDSLGAYTAMASVASLPAQQLQGLVQEFKFMSVAQRATRHRLACGHGVSLWRPQEFAALINEFANRAFGAATVAQR
jgi:malonyl CoA-acyl carrier protein transacylase